MTTNSIFCSILFSWYAARVVYVLVGGAVRVRADVMRDVSRTPLHLPLGRLAGQ